MSTEQVAVPADLTDRHSFLLRAKRKGLINGFEQRELDLIERLATQTGEIDRLLPYERAIKGHLCPNDAADWLGCNTDHHADDCVLCSEDNGLIPSTAGCYHEVLKSSQTEIAELNSLLAQMVEALREIEAFAGTRSDWQSFIEGLKITGILTAYESRKA